MKKLMVGVLCICLLLSTVQPVFATGDNAEKFLAARRTLSETTDDNTWTVIGIGAAIAVPVGAIIGYELFKDAIRWYDIVYKYNAFTEQVRKIGMPKELVDYFGRLPEEGRYGWEAVKNVPAGYTKEMGARCVYNLGLIDKTKTLFHQARRLSGDGGKKAQQEMERALKKRPGASQKSALSTMHKVLTEDYIPNALEELKKFRAKYPNLQYTSEYGWHVPMRYSLIQKNWAFKEIAGWEANAQGVIAHGKYRGMPVEMRETTDGVRYFVRFTGHNKAMRPKLLRTLSKKAVKAAPVLLLGIALLHDAPTASARDAIVAEHLRANPKSAANMSDEDANYILEHADEFPETIDVYVQYAQWAEAFKQLNSEQQNQLLQDIEKLKEQEVADEKQEQELEAQEIRRGLTRHLQTVQAH